MGERLTREWLKGLKRMVKKHTPHGHHIINSFLGPSTSVQYGCGDWGEVRLPSFKPEDVTHVKKVTNKADKGRSIFSLRPPFELRNPSAHARQKKKSQ